MNKKLFLLSAVAIALASCSSDEIVQQNAAKPLAENALQIFPSVGTRGTAWDNNNFESFKLTTSGEFQTDANTVNTGAARLINQEVKKSDGKWTINGKDYYWPNKSAASDFTAWAPSTISIADGAANSTYTTDPTKLADLQDIVVAFNSGNATNMASGVPLKFRHITSQIVIKALNTAADKINISVKGARLKGIKNEGTWALPTASTESELGYEPWSAVQGSKDFVTSITAATLTGGTATDLTGANPLFLIPQQITEPTNAELAAATDDNNNSTAQYLSVLVQITDKSKTGTAAYIYPKNTSNDQGYAWAAVPISTKWEPGKRYTYTLSFKENGYGKVDADQGEGGTDEPGGDPTDPDTPKPGQDIKDDPVPLVLKVEVIDWDDVTEDHDM